MSDLQIDFYFADTKEEVRKIKIINGILSKRKIDADLKFIVEFLNESRKALDSAIQESMGDDL